MKKNAVNFKGHNGRLVVFMDKDASFDEICDSLRLKVKEQGRFLSSFGSSLEFAGKKLTEDEFAALFKIIDEESDMTIGFIHDSTGSQAPSLLPKEPQKNEEIKAQAAIAMQSPDTYFHIGNLRGGQVIEHSGSVVVVGDVNGGAEVVSAGNVIVLGVVRGLIAAGNEGNEGAFIGAVSLQPEQFISIAGVRINYTKEMLKENKAKLEPVYAHLKDGNIYIDYLASIK